MKRFILTFLVAAQILSPAVRASWEYMELAANGFMIFDAGKFAKQSAMAMMMGTVGDAATVLGKTSNILNSSKETLDLETHNVEMLAGLYANLGARQSAASTGSGTALLDTAIEFGDLNDRILSNALEQAEKEGMDPRAMQSLAQTVHGTARIQVFDEVLRMYEKMGGARLSIAERANLKAQIDLLNDDQLNHETIVRLAKAQREVYESQQKADAAELGRRVVHNAARQGLRLDGEYADYAPTVDTVNIDPGVYKYDEIGGMVSIVDPSRTAIASANPFVGNPFAGAKGSELGIVASRPETGGGEFANMAQDPSFSYNYANIPAMPDSADSNQRAAWAVQEGLLYSSSQGWCARGANNILSYYVNGNGMGSSGANAKDMGPILQSRYGMSPVMDTGTYQNGDTRVLSNKGYGHIETYMNGRWYSDFPQNNSSVGSSRYSTATLYRLPASRMANSGHNLKNHENIYNTGHIDSFSNHFAICRRRPLGTPSGTGRA